MSEVVKLEQSFNKLIAFYNQQVGIHSKLESDRDKKEKERDKVIDKKDKLELEIQLLTDVVKEAKENAKETLKYMTTNALQFIMGDNICFDIDMSENGADFLVRAEYGSIDEIVETDPAEEEGGGIADICSCTTQIGMLNIMEQSNFAPLLLDEPSKYVSKGYSEPFAKFLFETSSSTNRQTIMVTHDQLLAKMGNKAYHFRKEDGRSIVTSI